MKPHKISICEKAGNCKIDNCYHKFRHIEKENCKDLCLAGQCKCKVLQDITVEYVDGKQVARVKEVSNNG